MFDISADFVIIPPDVDNYFLTYKFYYTTSNLGATKLTERNTNSNVGPGEMVELGNRLSSRISLSQLGTISARNGEITFVFIDNNGVQIEKIISVDWYN